MAVQTIACRQLVEMVTDYLENALTPAQMTAVRDHLDGCANCDAYLDQMRAVTALNRSLFDVSDSDNGLPPGLLDSLMNSFRNRSTPG